MPNNVSFFAIHVDDVDRGRSFYERVFGWRFEPWGPPGFYLIHTGDQASPGIPGAMHARQTPLTGTGLRGFECTIAVADIDATATAIEANGGKITLAKMKIPTVGTLVHFEDTERNHVAAMQYDQPH